MSYSRLAHFLMTAQAAQKMIKRQENLVGPYSLIVSGSLDLAVSVPDVVKDANSAASTYQYLFAFENYLRNLIVETLSEASPNWWEEKVPTDVKQDVKDSEQNEDTKSWMALGAREKIYLTTYPQLLRIIETCWKDDFSDIIKDKALLAQARLISHLRNAICHMTDIPEEEVNRIKQLMRDWFRVVPP